LTIGLLNLPVAQGELWSFPLNLEQAEALKKSNSLIIKVKSAEILFKIYEKFSYKTKITKKEINPVSNLIKEKYALVIFENFMGLLSHSTQRKIPDRIIFFSQKG